MKNSSLNIRSRKWFCRITQTNKIGSDDSMFVYDFKKVFNTLSQKYDKVAYIIHDKKENNIHAHFIIQNKNQISKSTLIKIMPYGDIELQRGTNLECYNYLLHKGQPDKESYSESSIITNFENEISEWLNENKNVSISEEVLKEIYSGKSLDEIRLNYSNMYVKNYNSLIKIRNDYLKKEANKVRKLEIVYICNDCNDLFKISLSKVLEELKCDYFRISEYCKDPFSNYNGEKIITIDFEDLINGTFFNYEILKKIFTGLPKTQILSRYENKFLNYDVIFLFVNTSLNDLSREYQRLILKYINYNFFVEENKFIVKLGIKKDQVVYFKDYNKIKDIIKHIIDNRRGLT